MARGLVFGWASPLSGLFRGADRMQHELTVITNDADTRAQLRDEGIEVITADPASYTPPPDEPTPGLAIIATSPNTSKSIVTRLRRSSPDTHIIVYCGPGIDDETREALDFMADQIVDYTHQVADSVLGAASSAPAIRAFRVRRILRSIGGDLCVYPHDNPDPDAIASAVAVVRIAERLDVDAAAYHYGEITHQSNRAFINALDLPIQPLEPDESPESCQGIVLVDHAVAGRNNSLDPGTPVDLVFDHHRPSAPVDGVADIRESVGATSSIMVEYLDQFHVPLDRQLATALLYGIITDTRTFRRNVTTLDFVAIGRLWSAADLDLIDQIEDPGISSKTLRTIASAIRNRTIQDSILAAQAGSNADKDALAQAADLLVQMEGISTVLVYGIIDGTVYASARARNRPTGFDLSEVIRDAYAQIGSAGGHQDMAGAQIPLGFLGEEADDDSEILDEIVSAVVEDRFFEAARDRMAALQISTEAPITSAGSGDAFGDSDE